MTVSVDAEGLKQRLGSLVWVRGEPRIENAEVLLERTGLEDYILEDGLEPALALASVRQTNDVCNFVRRFGLLRYGRVDLSGKKKKGVAKPTIAEHIGRFLGIAQRITEALTLYGLALDARAGKEAAWGGLRARHEQLLNELRQKPDFARTAGVDVGAGQVIDDTQLIRAAAVIAGLIVNNGLVYERHALQVWPMHLFDRDPSVPLGRWRWLILPSTLYGFICGHLASAFVEETSFAKCEGCERWFVVPDRRQRFCSNRCATRLRVQRHYHRNH